MARPLNHDSGRQWGLAVAGSVVVHVVALAIWALTYEPHTAAPEPTRRRVIKAIALAPTPAPAPTRAPDPKPEPKPEPERAPESERAPEPDEVSSSTLGPPPPPAPCRGCALMPSALGVPKQAPRGRGQAIPWGVPGGVPGGVVGGVPGGVVGGVVGGDLDAVGGPASSVSAKNAPEPLDVVLQRAIYTPDPDPKLLARTKTGMLSRHDGVNRTAFCIDARGKTVSVRTAKRFEGDPQVDEICLDAVKQWRFEPFRIDGRARRVCSVAVFEIRFE